MFNLWSAYGQPLQLFPKDVKEMLLLAGKCTYKLMIDSLQKPLIA